MALGKGLGQNAYAASNVYKGGASDDIQDVASRMADPNDPLALRLMAEATVLDIVRSARDADGQRPLSAAWPRTAACSTPTAFWSWCEPERPRKKFILTVRGDAYEVPVLRRRPSGGA